MPAPNDLTPEEEAMFSEHGVAPAGQGAEPINDIDSEASPAPIDDGTPPEPAPVEVSRHREDGTFKSKEEYDAEVAAAQAAAQPPAQAPQMVPLAALHEARSRSADLTRQLQTAMTRMNAMLAGQQPQGQQLPEMPNLAENPAGYLLALNDRLTAFEQARQEENQYREIDNGLEQDEQIFAQSVPDYEQASDYYVQSRARELLQFHTPAKAQQILTQEARAIATQAWQRGISAGQTIYQLAQARGYQPGNTAANPLNNPIPPGQPQLQVVPPAPQAGPTPRAQVQAINAGQQASRSLSGGAGGQGGAAQLNAQALLDMSDEEFEQHLQLGSKGANARFAQVG